MTSLNAREGRPRLALILGDRYGVGPEIMARQLADEASLPDCDLVVIGDKRVLERGAGSVSLALDIPEIGDISAPLGGKRWALLDMPFEAELEPLGRVSEDAGREVLACLARAAEAAEAGEIDGIVYSPLNKQAMRLAGHAAGDELDYLKPRMSGKTAGEINILGDLWTSRCTSHIPLREVGNHITPATVRFGIDLLHDALEKAGRKSPRLVLSALNPHAGEGGAYGTEEIDILAPAVAEAKARGIAIEGPFPSDTIFPRAVNGTYDGVVTLFHDQGQIALKMVGLGKGVTLLAGLSVPVATPGHGTAYDIAGTGKARTEGLSMALDTVARMAASTRTVQ